MVFHGEEDDLISSQQVEHEVLVHHEFAQVVPFAEEFGQLFVPHLCFCGFDRVGHKRSAGLWESAQCGDGIVEESVEETVERCSAVGFEECFDGRQVG